tara:strand:- start:4504 stop:5001 length:498 start_codon:yes stop_codon:yes gene_type:complete
MKNYKIINDEKMLRTPCAPCRTIEEGEQVVNILLATLQKSSNGVGLAANQVGIQKSVCVINVKKPIALINPKIVGKYDKFLYKEGCLSFPGDYVTTERYKNIMVKADNHKDLLSFSSDTPEDMLECACVQHEIDHLNGITMYDRTPALVFSRASDLLIEGIKNGK